MGDGAQEARKLKQGSPPQRTDSELCLAYQHGDMNAWGEMVKRHTGYVYKECKKWIRPGIEKEDLHQTAFLNIREAMERFDPSRAIKFLTYAGWWIKKGLHLQIAEAKKMYPASGNDDSEELLDQMVDRPQTEVSPNTRSKTKILRFIKDSKKYGSTLEERKLLCLTYDLGSDQRKRRWKNYFFKKWLQQHSSYTIASLLRKMEAKPRKPTAKITVDSKPYTTDRMSDLGLRLSQTQKDLAQAHDVLCFAYWRARGHKTIKLKGRNPLSSWYRNSHEKGCRRCKIRLLKGKGKRK